MDDQLDTVNPASTAMADYFNDLIVAKRRTPADDLLSALIRVTDDH